VKLSPSTGSAPCPAAYAEKITPTASITKAPSTPTRRIRLLPQRLPPVPLTYSCAASYPASVMTFPLPVSLPTSRALSETNLAQLLSSALVGRGPYLVRQGTRPGCRKCRNTYLEVWWSAGGVYMGLVAICYGPSGYISYGPMDHLYGPLDHLVWAFRSPGMGLWNTCMDL
jgi:hypothetical protein